VALGPEIRRHKATRRTVAPAIHRRRPQCEGRNTGTQGTVRARHMARRHAAGWSSVQRAKDAARRLVPESALRCGLGWLRCGVTTWAVRCELRSCGNDDAPAHGGSKARSQAWARKANGAREGKATVLTAGQRCSCRWLDEDGGAAWAYAATPSSLLCFGLPARRDVLLLPRRPVRLLSATGSPQQRRIGGDATLSFSFPDSTPPAPPLLFPPRRRT
jgi:hypothetical protein